MTDARQIYVVEDSRHRVVASARDAGQARTIAVMLLLGHPFAAGRDALTVREPEEEERAVFEARRRGAGEDILLGAIRL